MYLKPFLDSEEFAFCEWKAGADTLELAVPNLNDIIKHKKEWRAIIVNDSSTWGLEGSNKSNPFDFVGLREEDQGLTDYENIKVFREKEEARLERAFANPLVRLSIWFAGSPVKTSPYLCYESAKDRFDSIDSGEEYFSLLEELQLKASDVELDRIKELKYKKLCEKFELNGELFNPPKSIVTIAERAKNVESELAEIVWSNHTEYDYSQFYVDNLYPEKLRYILFDVSYIKKRKNENQYFNFITAILLLATNEYPQGVFRSNRVYRLDLDINTDSIREICNAYNSKMYATIARINELSKRLTEKEHLPVDAETAEEYFESDVTVSIDVGTRESRANLKAKCDKIGLSQDCPQDEYTYWDDQYHKINKSFVRFLREPRRAVKNAAQTSFREMNTLDDERALRLNDNQREDVAIALEESERAMIETSTTKLFDTARYTEQMRQADKEIRRGILQRMTRRKTLFVGLFAVIAYLIGFLPLLLGNLNTFNTFLFAILMIGIVLVLFLAVGFVYLIVLRHKLINRFKHFNFVMSGILKEIDNGVHAFSRYLSHACNVMRDFSVLNYKESSLKKKKNVLSNHRRIIEEKIQEANELFSMYVDSSDIQVSFEAEPFMYDFTVLENYKFEMPSVQTKKTIEFLQVGNRITVPIDYIDSVTLTREELYD